MFDVESTNLYGTGFAVGAIVVDGKGKELNRFELLSTESLNECCDFVKERVLLYLEGMPSVKTNKELRTKFYDWYMGHKDNCIVMSDVNYPVETNFLADVVKDNLEERQWSMPYPLYDMANFVSMDMDKTEIYQRGLNVSLRKHNPLDDAIASIYCFFKFAEIKEIKRLLK
jgi:hypothetical protein